MSIDPLIHPSWKEILKEEFSKEYFKELKIFLQHEKKEHIVYPSGKNIFEAYNLTPFDQVKVVIIGQDPYHGEGQAHGLCFSVKKGIQVPPSLKNIYKELESDLGILTPKHGDLTSWAKQGVFLLNAILTVRANQPASHQNKGWEKFTDATIQKISELKNEVVFLLWGKFAQSKQVFIDSNKHHILTAAHPSPFSAHHGFLGCKHFSTTNKILMQHNSSPINWDTQSFTE